MIGIDEVGRGPWAGPVISCAFMFERKKAPEFLLNAVNDSKTLSKLKREQIFSHLQDLKGKGCDLAVGQAGVEEIDALNIREATFLSMQRAVAALPFIPDFALIDGNAAPQLPCKTLPIIKGDSISLSIAAASIIAKVVRDHLMTQLAHLYPFYGWERNAGYGTREHQCALKEHGITPHHRKSFAPIRHLLQK